MSAHQIVHVDIPAADTKAGGAFYGNVFGWNIHTEPAFDYTMFQAEGGPGGGFVGIDTGSNHSPAVLIYIGTEDIDASLKQVEAHGGKTVTPKSEIPGIGWFAVFTDPSGNRIALYTDMPKSS